MNTRIAINLTIFGEKFNPEDLSKYIGIMASSMWRKGDIVPPFKGTYRLDIRLRKHDFWQYSSSFIETLDFEEVSNVFVNIISPKIENIKQFVEENNLEIVLNIIVKVENNETPGIHFNMPFIHLANSLNAEIDVDTYIYD
jgi:hypothetical protein